MMQTQVPSLFIPLCLTPISKALPGFVFDFGGSTVRIPIPDSRTPPSVTHLELIADGVLIRSLLGYMRAARG